NKYGIKDPYLAIDYTLNVDGQPNEKLYFNLVLEYYNTLFEMNKIDFNYILYESFNILMKFPHIKSQLAKIIKLVCVDEYQDTQELQYRILGLISSNNST